MGLHHTVAVDQMYITGINFNTSFITAIVGQDACGIIHGVHLDVLLSGSQHMPIHTMTPAIQGQPL